MTALLTGRPYYRVVNRLALVISGMSQMVGFRLWKEGVSPLEMLSNGIEDHWVAIREQTQKLYGENSNSDEGLKLLDWLLFPLLNILFLFSYFYLDLSASGLCYFLGCEMTLLLGWEQLKNLYPTSIWKEVGGHRVILYMSRWMTEVSSFYLRILTLFKETFIFLVSTLKRKD